MARSAAAPVSEIPAGTLEPQTERELPEPLPLAKLLGPSVVLVGVGIASGEYVLWPAIASQVGLVFLWAAVVGVLTQYFLNMEIERYTLATGETAITGFQRMWKGWGLVMCVCAILPNMWPGWVTSASTILTFLVGGGNVELIAILALLAIGITLTASPVIYQTVEKIEFVKVGAVILFLVVALVAALTPSDWGELGAVGTDFGTFPSELSVAVLLGALAFAGAGGTNNLVQSNWIRDKGFGMGSYAPRVVSPITGQEEAAPSGKGYCFRPTDENMNRWRVWWKRANLEQFFSFFVIGTSTILVFSLLAFATVFGGDFEVAGGNFDFIQTEGNQLTEQVGPWFGTLFWLIGCLGLFGAALGIVDYVSRLVADVLKVGYLRASQRWTESRIYFTVAWSIIVFGIGILALGFSQPLVLLVLSASISGVVMFIYSGLLIRLNRRYLPGAIKVRGVRLGSLVWAFGLFGVFSVILVIDQFKQLLGQS